LRKVFPQLDRREQRIIFRIQNFIQNTAKGGGDKEYSGEGRGEGILRTKFRSYSAGYSVLNIH